MKQAMIFAAGLGTRLHPLTLTMPKALVPVGGQPLLYHVVTKLKAAGFCRIVINVHHFASQITSYLAANQHFGIDIRISDESAQLLETGGGIKKARHLFDTTCPVLIHNVDILSNVDVAQFYDHAADTRPDALLLVSQRQTKRYLLFDNHQHLQGWTNIDTGEVKGPAATHPSPSTLHPSPSTLHPSPSTLHPSPSTISQSLHSRAFSGIHAISPALFPLMDDWPERFGIIDFYLSVCDTRHVCAYEIDGLQLLDVGKTDSLTQAEQLIAKRQLTEQ